MTGLVCGTDCPTSLVSLTSDSNGELTSDSQIVTQKMTQLLTQLMTPKLTQLVREGGINRRVEPLAN